MAFKTISVNIPIDAIIRGIKIAQNSKREHVSIDNERKSKYPSDNINEILTRFGSDGVKDYTTYLNEYNKRKASIVENSIKALEIAYADAIRAIDEQVTPNGADILGYNAGDFALIEHGLIASEDQLSRILEKHNNVAFMIAAQRYAEARNWEGFSFYQEEGAVRNYTDQVFNGIMRAASCPAQLTYTQYIETPSEYARIANEYGISKVFYSSGGDNIKKAIEDDLSAQNNK